MIMMTRAIERNAQVCLKRKGVMPYMPDFECQLKKYRQLKEMTQEQLAIQVGVRRETIMRLEKAQYNPSLKLAVDISRVVDAPIEEIFIFPEG